MCIQYRKKISSYIGDVIQIRCLSTPLKLESELADLQLSVFTHTAPITMCSIPCDKSNKADQRLIAYTSTTTLVYISAIR